MDYNLDPNFYTGEQRALRQAAGPPSHQQPLFPPPQHPQHSSYSSYQHNPASATPLQRSGTFPHHQHTPTQSYSYQHPLTFDPSSFANAPLGYHSATYPSGVAYQGGAAPGHEAGETVWPVPPHLVLGSNRHETSVPPQLMLGSNNDEEQYEQSNDEPNERTFVQERPELPAGDFRSDGHLRAGLACARCYTDKKQCRPQDDGTRRPCVRCKTIGKECVDRRTNYIGRSWKNLERSNFQHSLGVSHPLFPLARTKGRLAKVFV